jgi:hypothetical protein
MRNIKAFSRLGNIPRFMGANITEMLQCMQETAINFLNSSWLQPTCSGGLFFFSILFRTAERVYIIKTTSYCSWVYNTSA